MKGSKTTTKKVLVMFTTINGRKNYVCHLVPGLKNKWLPQFNIDVNQAKEFSSEQEIDSIIKNLSPAINRTFEREWVDMPVNIGGMVVVIEEKHFDKRKAIDKVKNLPTGMSWGTTIGNVSFSNMED